MKKSIYILICTVLFLQGCDKFLGIEPKGFTIPKTYEDYRRLLNNGALMGKAADSYQHLITDDVLLADGDTKNNITDASDLWKNLYTFAHGAIFNDGEDDGLWGKAYKRIYTFNAVINNVMGATEGTAAEKRTLRAEAIVGRAYEFLTLVSVYAPAYDAATATTDYGIPLVTSEDIEKINFPRASVAEVFKKIEDDLTEALPDLEDKVSNSFRPSKGVGYAFRARMYLLMGQYDKALENAKASLAASEELINLTEYTIKTGAQWGRIIRKDNKAQYPEGINNPENIYTRYLSPATLGLLLKVYASPDLLDTYARDLPDGAIDKRRELWYADNDFKNNHFPGYTIWCQFVRSNQALSTMDVILTAAECYARKGDANSLNEAARLYNLLRDNRIENNVHVNFTDPENAVRKIIDERRREFALTGIFRLADLKRLNKEPQYAKTITHTADGQTWTLPPNDNRYIFPIPPVVKGFHPEMPEYER